MLRTSLVLATAILLAMSGIVTTVGCKETAAFIAYVVPKPPKYEDPKYKGLENSSVAVLIYADGLVQYEYPYARLEMMTLITNRISQNVKNCHVVEPRTVLRYQDSNTEWFLKDKTAIARDLQVDHVLYICLSRYTLRLPSSEHLCRGDILADVSLYKASLPETSSRVWPEEVNKNEGRFSAIAPEQAVAEDHAPAVQLQVQSLFADMVAKKFYRHQLPEEE